MNIMIVTDNEINRLYAIYINTAYKKHLLASTDNQLYAERMQMLLEEMRKKGFLALGIASITVETE